uniref:Uncharacterized protein n=1 Tax=Anguilla anguilla TaxID=7936 RepID=A0A0E9RWH0_ANGAN
MDNLGNCTTLNPLKPGKKRARSAVQSQLQCSCFATRWQCSSVLEIYSNFI